MPRNRGCRGALIPSSELYIAIEGIDGTGKSHVARAISENYGLKLIKEPSDGEIGKLIYAQEWDPRIDMLLFFADRIHQLNYTKGGIVSDRSLYSTFAYQGVNLSPYFGSLDNFYELFQKLASIMPRIPSHVLLLYGNPELALRRIEKERKFSRFERVDYLKKVQDNYLYLMKRNSNFVKIDADIPLESLINKSLEIVKEWLHKDRLP